MKKKNGIWVKISAVAGAVFVLILVLGKVLGIFGTGYEMVQSVQRVPMIEARIDTVVVEQKVLKKSFKVIDGKLNAMLSRWNIPTPPDTS